MVGNDKSHDSHDTAADVSTAADIADRSGDTLAYCGVTNCRPCPDDVDQDPSVAVILPSVAAIRASLTEDDRVFVRSADGVVELLRVEPKYTQR